MLARRLVNLHILYITMAKPLLIHVDLACRRRGEVGRVVAEEAAPADQWCGLVPRREPSIAKHGLRLVENIKRLCHVGVLHRALGAQRLRPLAKGKLSQPDFAPVEFVRALHSLLQRGRVAHVIVKRDVLDQAHITALDNVGAIFKKMVQPYRPPVFVPRIPAI